MPRRLLPHVIAFNLVYLVFVYPVIGELMVAPVSSKEVPVVQACALIFAGTSSLKLLEKKE